MTVARLITERGIYRPAATLSSDTNHMINGAQNENAKLKDYWHIPFAAIVR